MFGCNKKAEYLRSVELFDEVCKEKGLYIALCLLYDSQYENKDIKGMLETLDRFPHIKKKYLKLQNPKENQTAVKERGSVIPS